MSKRYAFIVLLPLWLFALPAMDASLMAQKGSATRLIAMIDSLQHIVDTSKGETRVMAMRPLAKILHESDFDLARAIALYNEGLALSVEMNFTEGLIWAKMGLAGRYVAVGRLDTAMVLLHEVMKYLGPDTDSTSRRYRAFIYSLYSRIYGGYGMLDSSMHYIRKSINTYDEAADKAWIASTYDYFARVYMRMGEYPREVEALQRSMDMFLSGGMDASNALKVASISSKLGYAYMTGGSYAIAMRYFRLSDSIYSNTRLDYPRYWNYHAKQAAHIARVYQHRGQLDSALRYRMITLNRYREYGFPETVIDVPNQYCYLGAIYREKGDFVTAESYIRQSMDIRVSIADSLGVGMCLDEMAELSRLKGDYSSALELLKDALRWKDIVMDVRIDASRLAHKQESQYETYLIFGKVFADWNMHREALTYFDSAYILARLTGYKRGETMIQYHRGLVFREKGLMDSAYYFYDRSYELAALMGNLPLKAQALAGKGRLQLSRGEYLEAVDFFETAINIYTEEGFVRQLPELYLAMGKAMVGYGNRSIAEDILEEAHRRSKALGMIRVQSEAASALAELYGLKGEVANENLFLREYIMLHDSVFTLESHKQLAAKQAEHESARREQLIRHLEQENEINRLKVDQSRYIIFSLGGVVIVVLLFGVLFIRQIQIRNQQRSLINQQRLFRSQMNPHFIFNSLTNIQHYIFNKDSLSAGRYLAVFAKLMRSILNNSRKEVISLRDEVETIGQYLDLQHLRMEDKLEYELVVDDSLDQEITEIPPMLAQPFIENAIEHGIRNKAGKGMLRVRIIKQKNAIIYEVEDDGVGRKKAAELKPDRTAGHESMAVSLTRSRLQSLWGRRIPFRIFEIIDLEDEDGQASGTLVRFKVPL